MGATGMPLGIASALIFTIAYGIAVDDTIHFLHRYQYYRCLHPAGLAIRHTRQDMQRPMAFTTVVLCSGFMIFTWSDFDSIVRLGLLTSFTLRSALWTDLPLLPVLLANMEGLKPRR